MTDGLSVAKRVHIEQLFNINGQMAPTSAVPRSDEAVYKESVETIYNTVYAPALNRFLETRWYTISGLNALRAKPHLLAEFTAFVRTASLGPEESPSQTILAQETRLTWDLLNMCSEDQESPLHITESITGGVVLTSRSIATSSDSMRPLDNEFAVASSDLGQDDSQIQQPKGTQTLLTVEFNSDSAISIVGARIKVVESLLIDTPPPQISDHPLIPRSTPVDTPLPNSLAHQLKARQDEFWFCVGRFVAASGDAGTDPVISIAEMKAALHRARTLLDGFENRDVVYTIMRMRFLQRLGAGPTENVTGDGLRFVGVGYL